MTMNNQFSNRSYNISFKYKIYLKFLQAISLKVWGEKKQLPMVTVHTKQHNKHMDHTKPRMHVNCKETYGVEPVMVERASKISYCMYSVDVVI